MIISTRPKIEQITTELGTCGLVYTRKGSRFDWQFLDQVIVINRYKLIESK